MTPIWMRVRSELRARMRATVALSLLVGLGGGIAITAATAARRTDTAYPRFLQAHGGAHLLASDRAGGESFFDGRVIPVEEFGRMDGVVGAQKLRFYLLRNPLEPIESDQAFMTAEARAPERAGPPIDTYKVLEGRAPDPTKPEEAVVTIPGSERDTLRVGATFRLEGFPDVFPDFATAARRKPLTMKIVGRVAVPGDFPPQSGDETIALRLTPAFYERYPELGFGFPGGVALRLADGPAGADRFRASYALAGGNPSFTIERALQDGNVQRSIHLQAIALWLFAAFAAVAFVLVIGQTLARQIYLESGDNASLRALGVTPGQLMGTVLLRGLVVSLAGAAVAAGVAIGLSPLGAMGLARTAEPSPGVRVDFTVIGLGVLAVIGTMALLALWPAWRASRARFDVAADVPGRPATVAEAAARVARSPSITAGIRLAFHRGRGRNAMPVVSTVASLILGILVLTTAATFWFSLNHFLGTPRLYGVTWDARVGVEQPESFTEGNRESAEDIDLAPIARQLVDEFGVDGVSLGRTGFNMATPIEDMLLEVLAMDRAAGEAPMPPLLSGRYPAYRKGGEIEVMLGSRAAERLGARVGSRIPVMFTETGEQTTVHVVGVGVVPIFVDTSRLGEAALVPLGAMLDLGLGGNDEGGANDLFVRGNVDLERIASLAGPGLRAGEQVHIWPDGPPEDVVNFGRVNKMPLILGLMLGAFAAATLAHTLVAAIGRRRRDLAVLKTLGFVRAQIRRAVRTQSLALVGVALTVGVPLGVAAGRWIWRVFAQEQGVLVEPVIYPVAIVAGVAGALLVALLVAALPARAAARTQPALILRTE